MGSFLKVAAICLLAGMWVTMGMAAEIVDKVVTKEQIRALDDQVQDFKKDVLDISTRMIKLEEKLINPPNTQISVFLSVAEGDKFRLDAVNIKIDGTATSHHIYSSKELEALRHGGVQRIYTGNIRTGEHVLNVELIGKSPGDKDYQERSDHKFTKDVGAKLIEITLAGTGSSKQGINFRD